MKKKLLYFFLFFILIILFIVYFINKNKYVSKAEITIENDTFKISKIKYYSGVNAVTNTTNYQNPEWNIKVYQYTDIALYLDRLSEVSDKNYITNLSMKNFKLEDNEEIYYLNPTMFGNSDLNRDYIINNNEQLDYNVINSSNSNDEQNYNIPIFFQDCSNPITLRFVHVLSNGYKVLNDDTLIYNGSLIKKLGIGLESLNTKLSFDLEITTKDGIKKSKTIKLDIPLESDDKSILDGDFEIEMKEDINI